MSEETGGFDIFEAIGAILIAAIFFVFFVSQFTGSEHIVTFLSPLYDWMDVIAAAAKDKLVGLGLQVTGEAITGGLIPFTEMGEEGENGG